MGSLVMAVTRYLPQTSVFQEKPGYREYEVRLVKWDQGYTVQTPWACLTGRPDMTDEDLIRMGGGYATAAEAVAEAWRTVPYWDQAAELRERLLSNIHHHGELVGSGRTADEYDLPSFQVYAYARGAIKLPKGTKRREIAARAWH